MAEAFPLAEEFLVHLAGEAGNLGRHHFGTLGIELLKARKYRGASLTLFGNPETGEVTNHRLKVTTFPRHPQGPGYDFDDPTSELEIRGEAVVRLRAFLNEELPVGRYRMVDVNTPTGDIVALLEGDEARAADLLAELTTTLPKEALAEALRATETGQGAAQLAEIERRRTVLDGLDAMLDDPVTTESTLAPILKREPWIFGSRFIASIRTTLLPLDDHDLSLLTADGSLHIVELKGCNIGPLVRRPREHWIVGAEVHEAAMQAANYVRTADELGATMETYVRNELGIDVDMRRPFATVVIGSPRYQTPNALLTATSIPHALRTYNALLNRVEVLTYDQLFETARRSLTFVEAPDEPDGATPAEA
jgi:hypothetical protein